MVTIYDIAQRTGFSPPSVSKALNGTGGLSPESRAMILRVAEEMGYTPNMTARTLSTNRSNLVGVIYEDYYMLMGFKHPLFSDILNNFRTVVESAGYDLLFLSRTLGERKMTYTDHCRFRNVDGVLILNPVPGDPEITRLVSSGISCVSANEPIAGISSVITENVQGARDAVQYLIDLGHRRIAYISGPYLQTAPAALERLQGYKDSLLDNGLPFDEDLVEESHFWHTQSGYEATRRLLERTTNFTAVFASNDTLASGVKLALEDSGIYIPHDVSLIGFDGDDLGSFMTPGLTTMEQDSRTIGNTAAEILLHRLSGDCELESIRVPATLLKRDSCRQI